MFLFQENISKSFFMVEVELLTTEWKVIKIATWFFFRYILFCTSMSIKHIFIWPHFYKSWTIYQLILQYLWTFIKCYERFSYISFHWIFLLLYLELILPLALIFPFMFKCLDTSVIFFNNWTMASSAIKAEKDRNTISLQVLS